MSFSGLVQSILNLIGITQAPSTVQDLFWDIIVIAVGVVIIKAILAFVFGFFKLVSKF